MSNRKPDLLFYFHLDTICHAKRKCRRTPHCAPAGAGTHRQDRLSRVVLLLVRDPRQGTAEWVEIRVGRRCTVT